MLILYYNNVHQCHFPPNLFLILCLLFINASLSWAFFTLMLRSFFSDLSSSLITTLTGFDAGAGAIIYDGKGWDKGAGRITGLGTANLID